MKIGIIGAMEVEIKFLHDLMGSSVNTVEAGSLLFYEGRIHGKDVVLVRSGIGKVNAALCAQRLILQFNCTAVINTGIAGAMAHGLNVMDFVVSTDCIYHDMDTTEFGYKVGVIPQMEVSAFPADRKMIETCIQAFNESESSKNHRMMEGRIASGDQFISDKALKEKIAENLNPACVEMEGAAIAHACYLNHVPFVILRCMSDMADNDGTNTYEFNETEAADLSAGICEKVIEKLQ